MFDRFALDAAIAKHGHVARIVVAEVRGSAPREVGASMLVWADSQSGTIGGGALEHQASHAAREMLALGEMLRCNTISLGPDLGQCCGGAVRVLTEVFHAAPDISAAFARPIALQSGTAPLSVARALAQARRGINVHPALHDGWFIEPMSEAQTPVWIWGAGHVGRALVAVLAPLPQMAITWVDTDLTRFPGTVVSGVRALPAPQMAAAVALAPKDSAHVILTFSHALDLALCDGLLYHGFASCGLIGSATKWARFKSRLAALGHGSGDIARIDCPIGTPALGKHPHAIAIGVAARIMADIAAASDLRWEAKA